MPLPNLLFNVNYLGHLEDSGNDVGDFFDHKVMQMSIASEDVVLRQPVIEIKHLRCKEINFLE